MKVIAEASEPWAVLTNTMLSHELKDLHTVHLSCHSPGGQEAPDQVLAHAASSEDRLPIDV